MNLKKLFKNSSKYIIIDIFAKLLPFLTLPILTRYLTQEDFGKFAIFSLFFGLSSVFVGLGINGIVNINFFKMQRRDFSHFVSNCILILLFSLFFVLFIVFIFADLISLNISLQTHWQIFAIISSFFFFISNITTGIWIVSKQTLKFGIYQILNSLFLTALILILVFLFDMGYKAQIIAHIVCYVLFGIISLFFLFYDGYLEFSINFKHIKEAFKFGIFLIPHSFSNWLMGSIDRLFIENLLDIKMVGVYFVAFQVGAIMLVLCNAFNKAYIPELFKFLSNEQSLSTKIALVKASYKFFMIFIVLALVLGLASKFFIRYYLGSEFLVASLYIHYFFIAFAFSGMYLVVTNYIFYFKKTYILSVISCFSSALHIVFLYFFIGYFGLVGATTSLILTNFIKFIGTFMYVRKIYPLPWLFWRVKGV